MWGQRGGFNPRLPGGRRRPRCSTVGRMIGSFNPRLPGGRRPVRGCAAVRVLWVSIHAFRGEGDGTGKTQWLAEAAFQSTPSGGKATWVDGLNDWCELLVSIHAFRGEGDGDCNKHSRLLTRFNPRLPGGRRLHLPNATHVSLEFQSTPSGGKATRIERGRRARKKFQSTPSGGKATSPPVWLDRKSRCFNPRLPGGRRRSVHRRSAS